MPSARTRGSGTNEHRRFCLILGKCFLAVHWQRLPRGAAASSLDISVQVFTSAPRSGCPFCSAAWARWARSPCQPRPVVTQWLQSIQKGLAKGKRERERNSAASSCIFCSIFSSHWCSQKANAFSRRSWNQSQDCLGQRLLLALRWRKRRALSNRPCGPVKAGCVLGVQDVFLCCAFVLCQSLSG